MTARIEFLLNNFDLLFVHLRQLATPVYDRASPIWSSERIQRLPLSLLPHISALNARPAGASSYI